ncbi:MAG: response regulator transcription factor [Clostridia bacterium]|nr:response regulator transcription factor [Clostridia bacterium]
MNIAICDDNNEYINIMEAYIESRNDGTLDCDAFYSGEELIGAYNSGYGNYDVIFLDMEMDKLTGIQTANLIRNMDKHVIIVFVTGHTKYMQKCFECLPFRFLVKPVAKEELDKVFNAVIDKMSEQRSTVVFSENRNKIRLFCDDIIYFECQAHYIQIYTKSRTHKICKTMSELIDSINPNMFLQVHKSFVINLNQVREIRESEIVLYDADKTIPISRSFKKQVSTAFINFKERKYLI